MSPTTATDDGAETLDALLDAWADDAPDDVVVLERQGLRRRLTAGELRVRRDALASWFASLGAGPDAPIVVWLPNRLEWVETMAAAARLGAPVVGLNTRYRAAELAHVLARSGAAVLVASGDRGDDDLGAVAADVALGPALQVVVVGERSPGWVRAADATGATLRTWTELPLPAGDDAVPRRAASDDLLIAFTTSGTTGLPKLAAHDHRGVVRHARRDAVAFDVRPADRVLLDLPLCGAFGFNSLAAAVAGRATTLLDERFDPADSARALADEGVTHYNASDDMILRILDTGLVPARSHRWREGAVANFVNASRRVIARAEDELGVRLTGVYGSSEAFALLSRWPASMPAGTRSRAGGILVDPGAAVRVVDPATRVTVAAGEEGELELRGDAVLNRYLGDPVATAAAMTSDGWLRSGDLGRLTADGGFEYLARLGDSLRLRGFLVDPAEIERRLEAHPAVRLAQVVGADRPGRGQVAVAFVQLDEPAAEDELRAFCAAGIADVKVPYRIVELAEFPAVDGPNGRKILKRELRDLAAGLVDAG